MGGLRHRWVLVTTWWKRHMGFRRIIYVDIVVNGRLRASYPIRCSRVVPIGKWAGEGVNMATGNEAHFTINQEVRITVD